MTRKILMLSAAIIGSIAAGAYYLYHTWLTPDAQIRRFIRSAPEYGRLPMKQAFERVRDDMRYPLQSAGSATEEPVARWRPTGEGLDSPSYELTATDMSAFGAGSYWIQLWIMRPKISSASIVVTKKLGPAQGSTSDGDSAWVTATGALVVDDTVPSVRFAAGDPHDAIEVHGESRLPSYAEALSRLERAGWMAAGAEIGRLPGSTIHRFRHASGQQALLAVLTRGEKPEVLAISITAPNAGADAPELLKNVLPDIASVLNMTANPSEVTGRCTASPAGNYVVARSHSDETDEIMLWRRVEFRGWPKGYFSCE